MIDLIQRKKFNSTPGPWQYETSGDFGYVCAKGSNDFLCRVMVEDDQDEEGIANALLMAAAPTMRDLLLRAIDVLPDTVDGKELRKEIIDLMDVLG